MSRLIDDLRQPHAWFVAPPFVPQQSKEQWRNHTSRVIDLLQNVNIPVIQVDEEAEYYFTTSDQERWSLGRDFPNVSPPHKQFWCEYALPKRIHSREMGDTDLSKLADGGRVGMLISALEEGEYQASGEAIPGLRWVLWGELFIDYRQPRIAAQGSHGAMFFAVDAKGAFIDNPWMQTYCPPEHEELARSLLIWFNPAWLAIYRQNCEKALL